MIESLFGCKPVDNKSNDSKKEAAKETPQLVRILDPKKAQNLAISLKALSVTARDVHVAVTEGKATHCVFTCVFTFKVSLHKHIAVPSLCFVLLSKIDYLFDT